MLDNQLYRIRIGYFYNTGKCGHFKEKRAKGKKVKLEKRSEKKRSKLEKRCGPKKFVMFLFLLCMVNIEIIYDTENGKLVPENHQTYSEYYVSNAATYYRGGTMSYQEQLLEYNWNKWMRIYNGSTAYHIRNVCFINWNNYMRSYNGNGKNSLILAHLNAGAGYLGKSSKGKEKLVHIENFLQAHKIDIIGISEANLGSEISDHEVKIDGYDLIRSKGNIARVKTYIRSELDYKVLD